MIGAIERAMVERLKSLDGAAGYRVRCESYAGQLEGEKGLPQVLNTLPALFVQYRSFSAEPLNRGVVITAQFSIFLAARTVQAEGASRHGTGSHVGSYQLQSDVIGLLQGARLGLEIQPLTLKRGRSLVTGNTADLRLSLLELEVVTSFQPPSRPNPDSLDVADFLSLHVDWTGFPPEDIIEVRS